MATIAGMRPRITTKAVTTPSASPPSVKTLSVAASPYLDPALAVGDRVDDLLRRMTLEEKLAQLGSIWVFEVLDVDRVEPGKAQERLGAGIGQITRVAGATSLAEFREVALVGVQSGSGYDEGRPLHAS